MILLQPDNFLNSLRELILMELTYREFVNAPKNLKDYFELGYLHPETDWLVFNEERYTFKEIHQRAKKTANALLDSGLKKG